MMITFSQKHTNLAKGMACLLLLLHHLFYNSPDYYDKFTSFFSVKGVPLACVLASPSKVCVAMFLILSGYGVAATLFKCTNREKCFLCGIRVGFRMILKLFASFVFVFLLFVPWQSFMGHQPYEMWYHGVIDFLGLADIFRTPTMNATWWYVSIAFICYALTPILGWILKKFPELAVTGTLCVLVVCEPRVHSSVVFRYLFWVCNYYIGMIVFKYRIFDKVANIICKPRVYRWTFCLPLTLAVFWIRFNKGMSIDPLFAVALIVFVTVCLYDIPIVSSFLQLIGRNSGNIFLMHTFIFLYNFEFLVYAPKYAPLIYIWCLALCLGVSVFIEWLKKISRYDVLVGALLKKINAGK